MGNHLVDMGAPMMGAHKVTPRGASEHNPSNVTGYSLIQADNIDSAKGLLKDHPHLQWSENCSIEVFECMEM